MEGNKAYKVVESSTNLNCDHSGDHDVQYVLTDGSKVILYGIRAGFSLAEVNEIRFVPVPGASASDFIGELRAKLEHDPVNHPSHYTSHPSGIECIEIVRHMSFNRGNSIKYTWRAGDKGNEIEDLEKAIWYLKDEVERLKKIAV